VFSSSPAPPPGKRPETVEDVTGARGEARKDRCETEARLFARAIRLDKRA